MSQLQRRFSHNITTLLWRRNYNVVFSHNITTLYRRLLIDVFFATLLQRCDMVERRRDVKTTTIQRRNDVVCLLGKKQFIPKKVWKVFYWLQFSRSTFFSFRLTTH